MVPYKNPWGLAAYYCGVFSAIPCIGALLGLVAVILGIIGVVHSRKYKEARGGIHAWVGIVAGGFFFLLYTVGIFIMMRAAL